VNNKGEKAACQSRKLRVFSGNLVLFRLGAEQITFSAEKKRIRADEI